MSGSGGGVSMADLGTTMLAAGCFLHSLLLTNPSPFKQASILTTILPESKKYNGGIMGVMMSSSPLSRLILKAGRNWGTRLMAEIGKRLPWKP